MPRDITKTGKLAEDIWLQAMSNLEAYKMHASGEWRQPSEKEATILRCVVAAKLSPAQWEKIWELAGLENVVSRLSPCA